MNVECTVGFPQGIITITGQVPGLDIEEEIKELIINSLTEYFSQLDKEALQLSRLNSAIH